MKVKSIRFPSDIDEAVDLVSRIENLENTQAIRKLMRIGFQHYVTALYREGKFSLREVADLLDISLSQAVDRMIEMGVSGNIRASDVMDSLRSIQPPLSDDKSASEKASE